MGMLLHRVRGDSMAPALRDGWDVALQPPGEDRRPRRGDIVAARRPGAPPVLHRVLRATREGFVTQGDACLRPDPPWRWSHLRGILRAARPPGEPWRAPRPAEALAPLALAGLRRGARLKHLALLPVARLAWARTKRIPHAPPPLMAPPAPDHDSRPPAPGPALEVQAIGDETLLHDPASGHILALNNTATSVFHAMQQGLSLDQTMEAFRARFPAIAPEVLARDVRQAWRQIEESGMIKTR